jgi:hypothetical protein
MFQKPTKDPHSGRHGKVIRFSTHNPHAENSYVFAEWRPARRPRKKVCSERGVKRTFCDSSSNPVDSTVFRNEPFGENVEGLSHYVDGS